MCQMVVTDFTQWLQEQLDIKNWRVTDLANHARLSTATVSRILNGQRKGDPETLMAIANALNISETLVYRKAGILSEENNNKKINETIEQIVHETEGMNEQDQQEVLAFIRMKNNLRQRQKRK